MEFLNISEQAVFETSLDALVTRAIVALECEGKYVFVHDDSKNRWTLPGGKPKWGETPRQCLDREIACGVTGRPGELQFKGLMKFRPAPTELTEFGALYTGSVGDVSDVGSFEAEECTGEKGHIVLWDLATDIGDVAEMDRELVAYA